jgi:hypothetical protein
MAEVYLQRDHPGRQLLMKVAIETIEGAFWSQCFRNMTIPGSKDGIAVLKEENQERNLVSVGGQGESGILLRMSGDPLREVSQLVITQEELAARLRLLEPWPFEEGLVRAHDILHGEGFFVKRRKNDQESRLVLANPRLLGEPELKEFADRLDSFLGFRGHRV